MTLYEFSALQALVAHAVRSNHAMRIKIEGPNDWLSVAVYRDNRPANHPRIVLSTVQDYRHCSNAEEFAQCQSLIVKH